MFLLTTKNTRVGGDYPRSYSQVLCRECQHWGLAGVPLWHSRVPAGDVTCELYCKCPLHKLLSGPIEKVVSINGGRLDANAVTK